MSSRAEDNYESFYVIRIIEPIPERLRKTDMRSGVYLTENARLGSLAKAQVFDSIEAAESRIARWRAQPRYRYQIQFCTRERPPSDAVGPTQRALIDEIMRIPPPYRRTAYNWQRGLDVKTLLSRESEDTYQRHRRFLLDYDIDISLRPQVRLITPKRKKIQLNNVPDATKNDPRQYFSSRKARPRPLKGSQYKKNKN